MAYYFTGNKTDGSHLAESIISQIVVKAADTGLVVSSSYLRYRPSQQCHVEKFAISATNTSVQPQVPRPVHHDATLFFLADIPYLVKHLKQAFLSHENLFFNQDIVTQCNLPSNCIPVSIFHIRNLLRCFYAS